MDKLVIGTRGSRLSLAQTKIVTDRLAELFPGLTLDIKTINTHGDLHQDARLVKADQVGVFVKEIDRALASGEIDAAVHSLKDVPTSQPDIIRISAIVERADPRDVLISRSGKKLAELPPYARIGTSSVRRKSQLLACRSDLDIVEMRGNVDGRIAKLDNSDYDAIVLAAAGVERLGLQNRITEYLPLSLMLPAPGQGALAIETRSNDKAAHEIISKLDDVGVKAAVEAERTVLSHIGGGCDVPLGILAKVEGAALKIDACITGSDGAVRYTYTQKGSVKLPEEAGLTLAEKMLMSKAMGIIVESSVRSALCGKLVMVTREEQPNDGLCSMLLERAAIPIYFPTMKTKLLLQKTAEDTIPDPHTYDAIVVTSKRSVPYLAASLGASKAGAKVIAVGDETKRFLEEYGIAVTYVPEDSSAKSIPAGIGKVKGTKILVINSARAENSLAEELTAMGAIVERINPYTIVQPQVSLARRNAVAGYKLDFITFASPSAVEGLLGIMGECTSRLLSKCKVVCIGETTAKACIENGILVSGIARQHSIQGMVSCIEKIVEDGYRDGK